MTKSRHICMWSGPRNISTAMLYSFAQRTDTKVFDEPLYAHYLLRSGNANYHPSADEVIKSQENNGERVIEQMLSNDSYPIYFYKHMAHHLVDLDMSFLGKTINVILTREPKDMILSFAKVIPKPKLEDLGYAQQLKLINTLIQMDQKPIVIDSKSILLNPPAALKALCHSLQIPFEAQMLEWKAGQRPEDGVWAKHWYSSVHQSNGFLKYRKKEQRVPDYLFSLCEESTALYKQIQNFEITV